MKRFYRSREERVVAGICGGAGEMLGVDPVIIRLVTVFAAIATGLLPLLATYIIGWIIVPVKPDSLPPSDTETGT